MSFILRDSRVAGTYYNPAGRNISGSLSQTLDALSNRKTQTQRRDILDEERSKKALVEDTAQVASLLDNGQPQQAVTLLQRRIAAGEKLGKDMNHTSELLGQISSGDLNGARAEVQSVLDAAKGAGYAPAKPIDPKGIAKTDIDKDRGLVIQTLNDGSAVSEPIGGGEWVDNDIRKEARGVVRDDVDYVKNAAGTLATNFKKIGNLSKEVEKGNRTAVAQTLVSLVKLGDPASAVLTGEMVAALNSQDPMAAVADLLQNNETSPDVSNSVMKLFDPLNPTQVKVNDVRATANALMSANIPDIMNRYSAARELAEGNLSEAGMKSIFSGQLERQIQELSRFEAPQSGEITEELIQEILRLRPNYTREQVIQALNQ